MRVSVKDGLIGDDELEGLFGRGDALPLALAVSGGADSMALMHLVARWLSSPTVRSSFAEGYWRISLDPGSRNEPSSDVSRPSWLAHVDDADQLERNGGPPPVVVLTVDHGLRPGSAADAAFVAEEARKLGLPCEILRWEGDKPATGIQEAAREARRRLLLSTVSNEFYWLGGLLARGGRDYRVTARTIVMAHHADDQAETFLMRLARGSGLDGLCAMRAPDGPRDEEGEAIIWRPLIDIPKARLRATLEAVGLPWREDPSNDNIDFERVRMRKALAELGDLGIAAPAIAKSAARLAAARRGYLSLLAAGPETTIHWHDGILASIDASGWAPDVVTRLLQRMLAAMGGTSAPPRLSQIEALAGRIVAGAVDETLGGCRIVAGADTEVLVYRETGRGLPVAELRPGQELGWDGGRFMVSLAAHAPEAVTVSALNGAGWAALKHAVPGLDEVHHAGRRLPAAAVAGLPAFRAGGRLLGVPWLEALVQHAGSEETRRAWGLTVPGPAGHYMARFAGKDRFGA